MTTENEANEANDSGLSEDELAANQAEEAAAQGEENQDGNAGEEGGEGQEGQDDAGGEAQQGEQEGQPKKEDLPKGVVKRLAKMAKKNGDLERRLEEANHQLQQRPAPAQATETEKPTLEQFDYDDAKYIEALTDWKVGDLIAKQNKQNADATRHASQEKQYREFEDKVTKTNNAGVAKYDDYEEVAIESHDFITPQMADIITDSNIGHDIAYYLGENIAEAEQIFKLHPLKQAAAIGKLEAKLASKPAKKISNAAAPIKPVGAKGSTTTKLDPKKDWKKWADARNKEEFGH